ncbi:MAG: GNAT family N-acetyltransferase [Crocinitomicaceae bacterium]
MLKGDKIYLRAIEPSDAEQILAWENNTENWYLSNTIAPYSKHLIEAYVNAAQDVFQLRQVRFIICEKSTDKPCGAIDIFDFEPIHQRGGVGILIDELYRSKGYALDALLVLDEYALNHLGIRNLFCSIQGDNQASINLFEKAGYESVGRRKNWYNTRGKWVDELLFQKLVVK